MEKQQIFAALQTGGIIVLGLLRSLLLPNASQPAAVDSMMENLDTNQTEGTPVESPSAKLGLFSPEFPPFLEVLSILLLSWWIVRYLPNGYSSSIAIVIVFLLLKGDVIPPPLTVLCGAGMAIFELLIGGPNGAGWTTIKGAWDFLRSSLPLEFILTYPLSLLHLLMLPQQW